MADITSRSRIRLTGGVNDVDAGREIADAIKNGLNPALTSVFGRTGDVIAVTGDYRANQVTNAVDSSTTYSDPAWLTSLSGSKISGNISGDAATITGTVTESQVVNLINDLAAKAPLASPTFTGIPAAPTATAGTNTTQLATTAFVLANANLSDLLSPLVQTTSAITGATNLTSSDFGILHICSGTSADYTVTLPSPTGNSGKFIAFMMASGLTRLVTIAPNTTEKIDGASSRVMWANETATLYCDGTNWTKFSGKSLPMACRMYCSTNQSISNNSFTTILMDTVVLDNTGLMADTTNKRIVVKRPSTYICSGTVSWQPFTASSTNSQMYIAKNGVQDASQVMVTIPTGSLPTMNLTSISPGVNVNDNFTLQAYQSSGVSELLYGGIATFISLIEIASW